MYITEAHRKKSFALMNEVATHCGYESKGQFYTAVIKPAYNKAYDIDFSLKAGECTLDEYDRFLEFVLDIALDVGVQFIQSPKNCFNNTERYLRLMIKNKTCCITGKQGDIYPIGELFIALCEDKYRELSQSGEDAFKTMYHVHGVSIDQDQEKSVKTEIRPVIVGNVKTVRYSEERQLLGVQFKSWVPGANDKNVILYKMTPNEYERYIMALLSDTYLENEIYGKYEIVDI